jgi:hypothetical protein
MDLNIDDEIKYVIIDALDIWCVVGCVCWWIVDGFKCGCTYLRTSGYSVGMILCR